MASEDIALATLTRLYVTKHHLFSKARRGNVVDTVREVCGLHAQVHATPYLSLWNRVDGFENRQLDEALYTDKTLVKAWFMRGTLHVISSRDLPVYHKALRRMWFEHHGRFMRAPDWPPAETRRKLIYPQILEALADKPLTRKELHARVRLLLKGAAEPYDRLFSGWGGILKETGYEGFTVHAQPSGVESRFARLDRWLPDVDLTAVDEDEAQERLLLDYLKGYGPATLQDFSLWSGLLVDDAKRAAEHAASQLEDVQVTGARGRFLMRKEDRTALDDVDLEDKVPPRLLPKYDSLLLGHKDRSRLIREEHRKLVFKPRVGDVAATLLINGRIVGTWRQKKTRKKLTITVSPFEKISNADWEETKDEAKALGNFMGYGDVELSLTS